MKTPEQIETETRAALVTPESRAFVWWILAEAGIFRTTFAVGAPDLTAYNEGRRSLGLQILERIEATAPGSTDLMKKEALDALASTQSGANPKRGRGRGRVRRDAADAYTVDDYAEPGDGSAPDTVPNADA